MVLGMANIRSIGIKLNPWAKYRNVITLFFKQVEQLGKIELENPIKFNLKQSLHESRILRVFSSSAIFRKRHDENNDYLKRISEKSTNLSKHTELFQSVRKLFKSFIKFSQNQGL